MSRGFKCNEDGSYRWMNGDEKEFIDKIGQFSLEPITPERKRMLLMGYIAGLRKRVRWDELDDVSLLLYAKKALERSGEKC